ncbi:MAG: ABC transporter substrate-binding protein [Candidatus Lumbricidophila eiseniae]|uniref:ABC transporter substrate-binding protein n=1 Tax=Candidatus Lumbricidiphila eiseniae TaxID=1969409 RepID=A0A2A6FR77_9MICO|nr:MAG: ABC transporter substrate-binding protein [Candidatus Lumbricidophila eiseniae]
MPVRHSFRITALAAATTVAVAVLAGCAASTPTATAPTAPTAAAVSDSFPVTLNDAFGKTTIPREPTRVATWGWGSTEAAIAMGVYPVAVAEQVWTVGADKLLPWVEEAYTAANKPLPVLLKDSEGGATVPYEQIIAAKPDVILAPYSGLTQEQHTTLSKIAPTVAFPTTAWTTSWDDTIKITAAALGRSKAGADVLGTISTYLAGQAKANPGFAGKTFAGVWDGDGFVYVYTAQDARISVLTHLGLVAAPSVAALDTSQGSAFFYKLSYEKLDQLTADFIVSYHNNAGEAAAFLTKPALQAIPAVKAGKVAQVSDPLTVSSVSPPTALSMTWSDGMPALIATIAKVLK